MVLCFKKIIVYTAGWQLYCTREKVQIRANIQKTHKPGHRANGFGICPSFRVVNNIFMNVFFTCNIYRARKWRKPGGNVIKRGKMPFPSRFFRFRVGNSVSVRFFVFPFGKEAFPCRPKTFPRGFSRFRPVFSYSAAVLGISHQLLAFLYGLIVFLFW